MEQHRRPGPPLATGQTQTNSDQRENKDEQCTGFHPKATTTRKMIPFSVNMLKVSWRKGENSSNWNEWTCLLLACSVHSFWFACSPAQIIKSARAYY